MWADIRRGADPFASAVGRTRSRLEAACTPPSLAIVDRERAPCGTLKLGLALADSRRIETVLIPQRSRTTVCISTQVGCTRACTFCVTATMGLERSLSVDEIVGQVVVAIAEADTATLPEVRNVVFMGMGEPLDNLDATRSAIDILIDPHALSLAPGHLTLSTVGTEPEMIRKVAQLPVRLAWSLHSADDATRRRLVPTTRHTLAELRAAFIDVVERRRALLFIEITLVDGVNDSEHDATAVAEFLTPFDGRVRVNLLPMNRGRRHLQPTPDDRAATFRDVLRSRGYFCLIRRARGSEASAACGQLVTR